MKISGGQAPYTVSWDFDGAAPDELQQIASTGSTSLETVLHVQNQPQTFTIVASLTDAAGSTSREAATFTVQVPENLRPELSQLAFSRGVLYVRGFDPEGGPLQISANLTQGAVQLGEAFDLDSRSAKFAVVANDSFRGADFSVEVEIRDDADNLLISGLDGEIPPFSAAADSLYASFPGTSGRVNEPVRVDVLTGQTQQSMRFVSGVRLTCTQPAEYVPGSFDVGSVDGNADPVSPADGVWQDIGASTFLIPPESLVVVDDQGDGLLRLDWNITPVGGSEARVAGMLFSLSLIFPEPGEYRLGFEESNIVSRTYYQDTAAAEQYFWSDSSNGHPYAVITIE
ncbi:hypothetical protein KDL44_01990 [bacterium]|nr:hypothetical protein [bacterium]